jgi:hypothetical protein
MDQTGILLLLRTIKTFHSGFVYLCRTVQLAWSDFPWIKTGLSHLSTTAGSQLVQNWIAKITSTLSQKWFGKYISVEIFPASIF